MYCTALDFTAFQDKSSHPVSFVMFRANVHFHMDTWSFFVSKIHAQPSIRTPNHLKQRSKHTSVSVAFESAQMKSMMARRRTRGRERLIYIAQGRQSGDHYYAIFGL
jgi:hypothetical protein